MTAHRDQAKMKPNQVPTAWRGIETWLAKALPEEFRRDARTVVEIGTDWGYSFWHLLKLFPQAEVFSVDPYGSTSEAWAGKDGKDAKDFVESWVLKEKRAFQIRLRSVDAVNVLDRDAIDFLHIDGRHDYDSVKADFGAWRRHVRPGGLVAFHDTVSHLKTVGRFVAELARDADWPVIDATDDHYGMTILGNPDA